ncbi:DNA sulfur modification protein DndD [Candidatus Parabeggiatoa sp. HSG14]|uniref:DNA sulfur modification protein DndD n=1 Tax=Candidatus Parabeggiatoa sp. HSG14 TaxID=3055593 RepID=UPI0025A7F85A|nr:DNA sulfur modification protein DndD [Thiotrichales bacterium HSG14]
MWISKIELRKFKSYSNYVFNFPAPSEDGRHIILIGGMNGYGKTTLLQAIYLGLYGNEAIESLIRAGLMDDTNYKSFLDKALHRDSALKRISILIQFHTHIGQTFEIKRTWYFSEQRKYLPEQEKVQFFRISNQENKELLSSQIINEILDQEFVPARLASFFFFDGERINKLTHQNRQDQIRQGMDDLLGIFLLRKLQQTLISYQNNRLQNVDQDAQQKLIKKEKQLNQERGRLDILQKERDKLVRELEYLNAQKKEIENKISSLGISLEFTSIADMFKKQILAEQECEKNHNKLVDLLGSKFPLQLVKQELIDAYRQQIKGEREKLSKEMGKFTLKNTQEKFMTRFVETQTPEICPALTEQQQEILTIRLENIWQKLLYDLSDSEAEIMHRYLREEERYKVLQQLQEVESTYYDLVMLVKKKESLDNEVDILKKQQAKITVTQDDLLKKLQTERNQWEKEIGKKNQYFGRIDREVTTLTNRVNQLKSTYENEYKKLLKAQPLLSKATYSQKIAQLIERLIPSLYPSKKRGLKEAISKNYQKLSHKQNIANVDIDNEGNIILLDTDGKMIEVDRSAGEDQIFATALLAGLAEISDLNAPLIVDTPLGKLDSEHRESILNFWVSDQKRQVILLSQDTEIGVDYYNKFKANIAKTYLLEFKELGKGVGKTNVHEDRYFEGIE